MKRRVLVTFLCDKSSAKKQVKRGENDLGLEFRGYHTTWVKVLRQDCLQSMEAEVYGLR